LDGLARAVLDRAFGRAVRRLADKDSVHGSGCLQSRGSVDDVSSHHAFAFDWPGAERDDGLAGVDGDADMEVERRVGLVHLLDGVTDGKRGADRALGVVFADGGSPEDSHHRIADELLHGAPEALDL
jgi:hypothetical protein